MIPLGKSFCLIFILFWVFLFGAGATGSVAAQDIPSGSNQKLYFVSWEGQFLSWQRQGVACWLHDEKGNLRFEIMLGGQGTFSENLEKILDWKGARGWTVISVENGAGTFSRWLEQWQELPPSLDTWLRVVVAQTSGGLPLPPQVLDISPGGRPLALPLFKNVWLGPRVKRLQLPELSQKIGNSLQTGHGFRGQMIRRGHGRGGHETVLNLAGAHGGASGVRITSSHRPGTLHLGPLRAISAEFNPEEAFLPWWPLSGIINLKQ